MKTKMMLALAACFFLFSGTAFALHSGGVAHCDACHSMHGGAGNNVADGTGEFVASDGQYLLNNASASETCLNCHSAANGDSYHTLSTNGNGKSQGGDFFWVTAAAAYDFSEWHNGPVATVDTDNLGHNVIAPSFGLNADATNTTAPGGGPTASGFSCISCHDPHGQVNGGTGNGTAAISASGSYGDADPVDGSILGNFRLLGADGYTPDSYAHSIAAPIPVAASQNGGYGQSYGVSTDYGTGMSTWCLSCHPNFASGNDMHPVNATFDSATYNAYVATGDFTGDPSAATPTGGYDPLVPFARNESDRSALTPADPAAAAAGDTVMCLSCHRAHASAFDNILRWDNKVEFLAESRVLHQATTAVPSESAYYANGVTVDIATTYGAYQRQLCNKCHVKD